MLWLAVWPLRQYLRYAPLPRGKGFLKRTILLPILPPSPHAFIAPLPGGGRIAARYREEIGFSTLLNDGFETVETRALCEHVRPGTAAVDVGANIGVFTVPLAQAVGPRGKVLAFEPVSETVRRLRENIAMNALINVQLYTVALGDRHGEISMRLADDPALHSTAEVVHGRATGAVITVPMATLDQVWQEAGRPAVSAMKIDVEGAELSVLKGSVQVIGTCRPPLLIEANDHVALKRLATWLSAYQYTYSQPAGFKPWNHLFLANGAQP